MFYATYCSKRSSIFLFFEYRKPVPHMPWDWILVMKQNLSFSGEKMHWIDLWWSLYLWMLQHHLHKTLVFLKIVPNRRFWINCTANRLNWTSCLIYNFRWILLCSPCNLLIIFCYLKNLIIMWGAGLPTLLYIIVCTFRWRVYFLYTARQSSAFSSNNVETYSLSLYDSSMRCSTSSARVSWDI